MKKFLLIACIAGFSTPAFSQSVVTEPVGVKQKLQGVKIDSAHSMQKAPRTTSASRTTKRPIVGRKPVKSTK